MFRCITHGQGHMHVVWASRKSNLSVCSFAASASARPTPASSSRALSSNRWTSSRSSRFADPAKKNIHTKKQTNKKSIKKTIKQTNTHTNKQANKQTNNPTDTQTH
jgi:hypothetical protein